jgi:putative ABC transport system permease protein
MMMTLGFDGIYFLLARIRPDAPGLLGDRFDDALATLGHTWDKVTSDVPFTYTFLDEDLDRQYQAEQRWGRIVGYAALFALVVACLGLFGLATLAAAGRNKEIGIRKVLGASVAGVTTLILKKFAWLVLTGVFLAAPAAYFAMNRWLQDFAYRIEVGWSVFVLAGGLALVIALLTVSTQAIRAALANPVESLRYE